MFCSFLSNSYHYFVPEYSPSDQFLAVLSHADPIAKQRLVEDYMWQDDQITKNRVLSFHYYVLPLLLLVFIRYGVKLKGDWMDECFVILWLFSCVVDTVDEFKNWNSRPVLLDWYGFAVVFLLLLFIKYAHYPLWRVK